MRKLIGIAVMLALLSFAGSAYGVVGISNDHDGVKSYVGEASNVCFEGQKVSSDGSQVTVLCNGHKDGVTTNVSGESNLTSAALAYGVINRTALDNSVAYLVALANGTPGQMITIITTAITSGTYVITDDGIAPGVFTMTKTGWDDITFNAALDSVTLLYVDDSVGWIYIGGNSVTIT